MVLDDVTFARQVMEGKVTNITVTILGGKRGGVDAPAAAAVAGAVVTVANARAGLRVKRGPDWMFSDQDGGGCGVLKAAHTTAGWWRVTWEATGKSEAVYRCDADGAHDLVFVDAAAAPQAAAPGFRWEDVTESATILVTYTGAATDTLTLLGDAQHRVTKLCAWLPQNGLEQCGAPKDAVNGAGRWVRTIFFTRSDVPF
jgi:hypothetical protein